MAAERRIDRSFFSVVLLCICPTAAWAGSDQIFADDFELQSSCEGPVPINCNLPIISRGTVHINEVAPVALSRGIQDEDGTAPPMQWIELFSDNPDTVQLNTLSISTALESDGLSIDLPTADLNNGDHFTVWLLPQGSSAADFGLVNDLDLSDGEGHWYVDAGGELGATGDDIGLSGDNGLIGFFAYGDAFKTTSALETAAVAASLWAAGSRFDSEVNLADGEGISLYLDGFYPGLANDQTGPAKVPDADDYVVIPWIDLTAGIPQPGQAIQVAPRNGEMVVDYPVELTWRACPGASGYLLELFDSEADNALPVQRLTDTNTLVIDADDIQANPVYWTAACLYQNNTVRTRFPDRWNFATGASGGGGGDPGTASLSVAHRYQRKDTNMLCLYDDKNGNGYGCQEEITGPDGACNWDAPHNVSSAVAVRACGPISENYCVRASIQMVHKFLAPSLDISQDYVSFLVFEDFNPPGVAPDDDPEGDLGAGIGMTVAETTKALADVLNVTQASITVKQNPSHSDIRGWIDADRPVILFRWWRTQGGHATVAYGYQTAPFNGVFIHDPTDGAGLVMRYSHYSSRNLRANNPLTAIVPPAVIGAAPNGDPPNDIHSNARGSVFDDLNDQDGVVNFDEIYRFGTDIDNFDSDYDQVGDKQEIYSYTFPKGKNTIVSRTPDIDSDSRRAELDCNTDSPFNTDHDGGEDIDGDGGKGEESTGVGPGESDVFVASDGMRVLDINKFVFLPGEDVTLMGGTLHGQYSYSVTTLPCPEIPANTPLGGGSVFNTDPTGTGDNVIAVCESPGCYISYLDIADDSIWQQPERACDTNFTWICLCSAFDPENDIIDPLDGLPPLFGTPFHDIVQLDNQSNIGTEVNFSVITQGTPLGQPPVFFGQLILQVPGAPGADNSLPLAEGGHVRIEFGFPEVGGPQLQLFLWDPFLSLWAPDPVLQGQLQLGLSTNFMNQILLNLAMPGEVLLPGQPEPLPITGARVFTQDQMMNPNAIDAMPQPSSQSPAVFDQFVDLESCPQG